MADMLTSFTFENEKQDRMSFFDIQIILSTANLHLVEFIHILTAFYYLSISFVKFTHSLIEACESAQFALSCTVNHFV